MESSTSKIMINVLIVTAIALIGVSVVSVLIKKPAPTTPAITTNEASTEVATTTDTEQSTTTEMTEETTATSSAPKGLIQKTWTWTKTTSGTTTTVTPKKETAFTITFTETGSIQGTTDCNKFLGTYTATSNKISLSQLGSTKMYCEGSQEQDFTNTLQKISAYTIDKDNNLILTTASGTMVFK